MIPEIGTFALVLALLVALVQGTLPLIGAQRGVAAWVQLARPASATLFLLIAIAFGCPPAVTYASTAPLPGDIDEYLFAGFIAGKRIEMQVAIPPDLPSIRMDTEKIEVVVENLLSNALKYTADGGRITVSARHRGDAQLVEVVVSDTGRGIPESRLKEVFEKFKRIDDGKGSVRGTGLGLAIVKHIIKAHGGRVWAESELGKGSTFTFSLPA